MRGIPILLALDLISTPAAAEQTQTSPLAPCGSSPLLESALMFGLGGDTPRAFDKPSVFGAILVRSAVGFRYRWCCVDDWVPEVRIGGTFFVSNIETSATGRDAGFEDDGDDPIFGPGIELEGSLLVGTRGRLGIRLGIEALLGIDQRPGTLTSLGLRARLDTMWIGFDVFRLQPGEDFPPTTGLMIGFGSHRPRSAILLASIVATLLVLPPAIGEL